jgi:hypothetical protein
VPGVLARWHMRPRSPFGLDLPAFYARPSLITMQRDVTTAFKLFQFDR